MKRHTKPVAIVTGASSGIGAATAIALARAGCDLALCARREKQLAVTAAMCKKNGATVYVQKTDVTRPTDRKRFVASTLRKFGRIDILVNNAGGAIGFESYLTADERDWRAMFETNVFATAAFTRLVAPTMLAQKSGHIIFLSSIAAHQPYENGSGYCASKHAQRAMIESLRLELAAEPIRITSISPGMVETEFSVVRFRGDAACAKKVYDGITPLTAADIAELITFAVTRPPHVNISELHVFPTHQVDARKTVRNNL